MPPTGRCPAPRAGNAWTGSLRPCRRRPGSTARPAPAPKAPRRYSWAWIPLEPEHRPARPGQDDEPEGGQHSLLIRRNDDTGELAYHRCYTPRPVPLSTLITVAGNRWRIEESFQAAKTLLGLDQHQVRRWDSWHRWTTLAMLAHAFLTVVTATERATHPAPDGLIDLTLYELRRLFTALLLRAVPTLESVLAWSRWRRRHQARARQSHYRRRGHHTNEPEVRL
ncbi:hypothetical protein BN12_60036 [Nostocoides japonicum T1-X7]|uniref:Uncharacterized protein n=1 Tax=Nostocoides japonicum T1-X7 TaxID=1194083 RepID=A0A077M708_9MICO|nr:hypothetical protein BN12_60036 [Tetrasphaera japonica T1-X7]